MCCSSLDINVLTVFVLANIDYVGIQMAAIDPDQDLVVCVTSFQVRPDDGNE